MGNFVGVLMTGSFVIHNRRMTFIRIIFNCFTANRKDTNLVKMPMDLNGHLSILQLSCFHRKRSNYYPYRYVHFQVGFNMHGLDKKTPKCVYGSDGKYERHLEYFTIHEAIARREGGLHVLTCIVIGQDIEEEVTRNKFKRCFWQIYNTWRLTKKNEHIA